MSKVILSTRNPALVSLIKENAQYFPVDTNILIPPDRSKEFKGSKQPPLEFTIYQKYFLEPLMKAFPYLSIHEAVFEECVEASVHRFVSNAINNQFIILLKDSDLNSEEEAVRFTNELKIAKHTNYNSQLRRGSDKGEVKSLAYIAAKGLIYFCSRDAKAIRLINDAEKLGTNLDGQLSVHMYEVIYYLYKRGLTRTPFLKALYKYLYRMTKNEERVNPEWGVFVQNMNALYPESIWIYEVTGTK